MLLNQKPAKTKPIRRDAELIRHATGRPRSSLLWHGGAWCFGVLAAGLLSALWSENSLAQTPSTAASATAANEAKAPAIKIWEFSPYEVELWYGFDKDVSLSPVARQQFVERLQQELERTFRAAWRLRMVELQPELRGEIVRRFDSLKLDDLTRNELVLVTSTDHPEAKSVRTLEAAAESLTSIHVATDVREKFDVALQAVSLGDDSPFVKMSTKLTTVDGVSSASLRQSLVTGEIAAALLPRLVVETEPVEVPVVDPTDPSAANGSNSQPAGAAQETSNRATGGSLTEKLRPLLTWLPWQPSAILRERDKVIMLLIGKEGDEYTFRAREIDTPMQYMGPVFSSSAGDWPNAAHSAARTVVSSFAPIARVEEAEAKSANVRQRAGGLIVDPNNPALLQVGDVMQPIIRRDDRNGMPALLEPLSFTYAAMISTDGIKGTVNVYTYSGGPGLQGRQNRRTQRVLLRVRPIANRSDVQIAVRGEPGSVQAGCFIYDRGFLSEDFELIGRTDWRGRLTIVAPEESVGVLPEAIRAARDQAKREAQRKQLDAEAAAQAAIAAGATSEGTTEPPAAAAAETTQVVAEVAESADEGPDEAVVYLKQPLVHLYVKSGDMVLAKLPYVPGLSELDVAQLGDDTLRLKSEAFVRGFQGEILDLIGLRNVLYARVQLSLKEKKIDEAKSHLDKFRKLRTFSEMSDQLSQIQRRMLEESGEEVPRAARSRIDRMFQTTRDMLQKYLQDELLAKAEQMVNAAGGT